MHVQVSRTDYRDGQHVIQHLGDMQSAVAFSRADINDHLVQLQMHAVEHNGPQNGAVDPRDSRSCEINGLLYLRLIQIDDNTSLSADVFDDGKGRNAHDANTSWHQISSRQSR